MVMEAAILAGAVRGGYMGIATVIALLAVPYLIHWSMPPLRRILH